MGGLFGSPSINMPATQAVTAPAPASEEATLIRATDTEQEASKKKTQQTQGAKSLAIPIGTI